MVSTVTTTVTMVASSGFGVTFGAIVAVALLLLLVQREVAVAAGPRLRALSRNLAVAIAPLLVTFAAVAVSRLAALL